MGTRAAEQRHQIPSTVCILGSPRTPGTSPRIFQSRSVESRRRLQKNLNRIFLIPELKKKEKNSPSR